MRSAFKYSLALSTALVLGACSGESTLDRAQRLEDDSRRTQELDGNSEAGGSILDLFRKGEAETSTSVNKYLWSASLEVLNFLPVQSVDPFTGVIVTGFGIPPGGGRAYRATVLIDDPALDARSLNVALQTQGGRAVSAATARAVEDAILSRAREMRVADNRF